MAECQDLDQTDRNLLELSEHSMFFKNDYFHDQLLYKEEDPNRLLDPNYNLLKISNRDEYLYKGRLMYNYLNPRRVVMPKFTKISEKDRKCREIMDFKESEIRDKSRNFYDEYPVLKFRRMYYKFSSYVSRICFYIVKNQIFDNISLVIILMNSLLILISDPLDENSISNITDTYFLYFYTFEMFLKVFSFGFVTSENSYLREIWNILDFTVIIFGWLSFILENALSGNKIKGLGGLRAFRILRPLKTVKSIKGLKTLIVTLLISMMSLGDTVLVLFFFFLIFSITGLQMFQGLFLYRCMNINLGYFYLFNVY